MYTSCIIDSAVYSGLHSVMCILCAVCTVCSAVSCAEYICISGQPLLCLGCQREERSALCKTVKYTTLLYTTLLYTTLLYTTLHYTLQTPLYHFDCSVQCAVCSVQYSMAQFVCGVLQCTVHCALCIVYLLCSVQCCELTVHCVLCTYCALCIVYCVLTMQC